MSYEVMILPAANASKLGKAAGGCRIVGARDISEAIEIFRSCGKGE